MIDLIKNVFHIFIIFILVSCSTIFRQSNEFKIIHIQIDSVAVESFAQRVIAEYPNYSDYSVSSRTPDNIRRSNPESLIILNKSTENDTITLFTIDKKDSCIIFCGKLPIGINEIDFSTLKIPVGYYYIKSIGSVVRFHRQPYKGVELTP